MKLANSTVIVTGASAGIGKATVEALAAAGANVVLTARREERLEEIVAELAHHPGQRLVFAGDIRDPHFAQRLVQQTLESFGRVDVLINNAGLGHRTLMEEIPAEHMQTILDTNVLGLLYATQAVIPHMRRQGGGQIVNVSSIASYRPFFRSGFYAASKAAVNNISRALRLELRGDPIVISTVYPGLTQTEFSQARLGSVQKRLLPFMTGVPAERVAQVIVRAIERRRTEVFVSLRDRLISNASRLFPRTTDWLTGWGYHWLMRLKAR